MHFKSFGALTGTPEALKKMMTRKDCEVKELTPGEPLVLCIVCWNIFFPSIVHLKERFYFALLFYISNIYLQFFEKE